MCLILENVLLALVEMNRQDIFMRLYFYFFFPRSCCLASEKASGVALLEEDNMVCGQGNGTALAPASLGDDLPLSE